VPEGVRGGRSPYRIKRLPAVADDYEDANGESVLSFVQAQDAALAPSEMPDPLSGPITVATAFEQYVKYLEDEGRAQAAIEAGYRGRLHILPLFGNHKVAGLTPQQLRAWLAQLARKLAKGRTDEKSVRQSRNSANRILNTFRAALNHAFRENEADIPSNAAWSSGRVKPFRNVDMARVRYLSVQEAQRLINACAPDFRNLVRAALLTGARYSELCRLHVRDCDVDSGTLSIGRSKSGKSRRVYLNAEGEQFFSQLCAGRGGNDAMLTTQSGEAWKRGEQRNSMLAAVERARIVPSISFHGLRHTYCSLSLMNGVPMQVIAGNLGHSDTRMVERHYGHLTPSFQRDAIRAGAPRFGLVRESKVRAMKPRG
jgi:integrase